MLDEEEQRLLYGHAYVPEHLKDYVEAVSGAEPFLHEDHLCLLRKGHLTFIGYALKKNRDTPGAYESAVKRFKPTSTGVIAPEIWFPPGSCDTRSRDSYYILDLPLSPLPQSLDYMVRRGGRELRVSEGRFGREHRKLVKAFLSRHELSPEQVRVFKRIAKVLERSRSARLIEARKGRALAAFHILDLGSADFAFYLFAFRSRELPVPGVSDLLFYEMTRMACAEGKRAMNLGLGINPGIRRFKEKWGGVPFLPCHTALIQNRPADFGPMWKKL
ncbi:MAG: GNAT family N-acetyltransferase [Pseudomonadota bacterium]